jgi:murein tripeptide amidase MpaA
MRLAEYLASGSGGGGLASELVSGLEIWINPLANPDGMYRNSDTMTYPVRANSLGYDLNRNFPDPAASPPPPLQKETADMISLHEEDQACTLNQPAQRCRGGQLPVGQVDTPPP